MHISFPTTRSPRELLQNKHHYLFHYVMGDTQGTWSASFKNKINHKNDLSSIQKSIEKSAETETTQPLIKHTAVILNIIYIGHYPLHHFASLSEDQVKAVDLLKQLDKAEIDFKIKKANSPSNFLIYMYGITCIAIILYGASYTYSGLYINPAVTALILLFLGYTVWLIGIKKKDNIQYHTELKELETKYNELNEEYISLLKIITAE